jgi:hypothetical protein
MDLISNKVIQIYFNKLQIISREIIFLLKSISLLDIEIL